MEIPKVFISYSHDSQEHKKWVLELATRLRNNGIDAILDQYRLQAGGDITHFMETNLAVSDKILMVCTEKYVQRANKGEGGVGYEKMIITSNLMDHIDENKIIPIIRQDLTTNVPTFLKTKLYINFSKPDNYELSYDDLVRTIHNSPLFKEPPVGNNPFESIKKETLDGDIELLHNVLQSIIKIYNDSNFNNLTISDLVKNMNISLALGEVGVLKLINLNYIEWLIPDYSFRLNNKGKFYAYENGFIK